MSKNKYDFWLVPIAFVIVYIVWGTTYLANAWGVKSIPPFLFAGSRFVLAGILLLGLSRLFEPFNFTLKQVKNAAYAGFFLFAIGNGTIAWALQHIDSGIAALLVSFEPLIVVLMLWVWQNEKPVARTWIGLVLGFIGMVLLVGQPQFLNDRMWLLGLGATSIALVVWGYISIWIPKADLPKSVFQSAGLQMLAGGLMAYVFSFLLQEYQVFSWEAVSTKVMWAYLYLVVFGSIMAFSSFNFLLKKISPAKVATSAYVHPVIALFIGWWLNNEGVTPQSLLATGILLFGVLFINTAKSKKA